MSETLFLQIFLLINVFAIGVLAAIAFRHAYAHYKPDGSESGNEDSAAGKDLSPDADRAKLLNESHDQFQSLLKHYADKMQHDLEGTTAEINNMIKQLATGIVTDELERYRMDLAKLHEQAGKELGGINKAMNDHQTELTAKVKEELEAEKQKLIKQIDTKLGDAVGSFLLEALQHNVDLGSQEAYLMETLDEHKADFIKEVSSDDQPSK